MSNEASQLWNVPNNFYIDGKINKSSINREIIFPILKINNFNMKKVMKILKKFCPDLINFDKIISVENDKAKQAIIFDPILFYKINEELSEREKNILSELNEEINANKIDQITVHVSYENYKLSTLLSWLLPKENVISAFTLTGHIVHLNLKDSAIPFKHAIGSLLLDKVPSAKCVVSKVNTIDTEFRTFELDLLAGEPNYITTMKEHGVEFALDFSKVYWNSRLSTEHTRICETFISSDIVYDGCAGIGPFAIPAAKKGCRVIANDLNDESVKWLKHNMILNSTKKKKIEIDVYNMDARDFIKKIVIRDIVQQYKSNKSSRFFLIMNLPSIAINFLSSIVESEALYEIDDKIVLLVRCYCFIGKENPKENIERTINDQLGDCVGDLVLRFVRNVAPNKDMFCAEMSVNFSSSSKKIEHVVSKKMKLNN